SLPGDQRKATGEAPQGRDRQGGEPPGNRHGSSSVELAAKVLRPPLLPFLHNCSSMPFVFEKRPP
ncbi:MAG: hypothetical protein PVG99_11240, partial [Desulfobacteraceae bacterium]